MIHALRISTTPLVARTRFGPRFFVSTVFHRPPRTPHLEMSKSSIDLRKLEPIVEPIVRAHGGEVAELEWASEPGGWVLRVLVEKQGSAAGKLSTEDSAVSLELCANVARELSPALDVSDLVAHRYSLEVSSPGIERALKRPADFERFAGKLAKIKFKQPILGNRVVTGILGDVIGQLSITEGSKSYPFTIDDVDQARLVFQFGSQKPSKKPSKKAARA